MEENPSRLMNRWTVVRPLVTPKTLQTFVMPCSLDEMMAISLKATPPWSGSYAVLEAFFRLDS